MPSLLPNFEYDIFISYRHNDNLDGWVTTFVESLEKELRGTLKDTLTIYFDKNPHDGLQSHHEVDDSLREKLKSLILIPIVSQTYCDPKAFAWEHELIPFIQQASEDSLGLKTRVSGGNIASRVLPIKIHDIDNDDRQLFEDATGSVMRSLDFIYKESGVNRPLRPADDRDRNQEQIDYRNQVNKVANAIKEIISGLKKEPGNTTQLESNTAATPTAIATHPIKRTKTFRLPRMRAVTMYKLLAIVMFVAFVTTASLHFSEIPPKTPIYNTTILPPDNTDFTANNGGHLALSPNGQLLAFSGTDSTGKRSLWVRSLDKNTAQALNGTEGALSPFWSPDSRFIGFFADGKLKKIESSGGSPQILCDAFNGRGGSWNKDGTIIFCPALYPSPLFRVSSAGGTPVVLTQLDTVRGQHSHRWPHFLPDGEHFLYCVRTATAMDGDDDAIYIGSLSDTFEPRIIAHAGSSIAYANGFILYTVGQTLLTQPFDPEKLITTGNPQPLAEHVYYEPVSARANFSVSQNGVLVFGEVEGYNETALMWSDRNGDRTWGPDTHRIIPLRASYNGPRISPDGKRLAVSILDLKTKNSDIWLYEFARQVWTRFTFNQSSEDAAIWSPDGKVIVYSSNKNRATNSGADLMMRIANGAGGETPLLKDEFHKIATDWSHDGRNILYYTGYLANTSSSDIWVLPIKANTPEEPYPFLKGPFDEFNAVFSPDDRWVAYTSNESGRNEIYVRPFKGEEGKWQVSINGGNNCRWSEDGTKLYYWQPPDAIFEVEIKSTSTSIEIGTAHQLFLYNALTGVNAGRFETLRNGEVFLIMSRELDTKAPITLVVNWPEELKKK